MRVAIDARAYSWGGIGTYLANLIPALIDQADGNEYVILVPRGDEEKFAADIGAERVGKVRVVHVEPSYYSWREQTTFLRELYKLDVDLYHFAHFNVPVAFQRPYVVTIHDATRFVFCGQRRQGLITQIAYEFVFSRAIEGSAGVICVSKATERELRSLPLRLPERVRVIPEGVDPRFFQAYDSHQHQLVRAMLGFPHPYFLYAGVWMSHKNIRRMLEAFARLGDRRRDVVFVLTGEQREGYVNVPQIVKEVGLNAQIVQAVGHVPQEYLPALYGEALALLYASLYEGFGLPALEAAAAGTPVIAANVTSLPEIMSDAALYVNPEHIGQIEMAMVDVIENVDLRTSLIHKGKMRARLYSWEQCAAQTAGMYRASAVQ